MTINFELANLSRARGGWFAFDLFILKDRFSAGELLPPLDDDVDILGIELNQSGAPPGLLAGDQRRT